MVVAGVLLILIAVVLAAFALLGGGSSTLDLHLGPLSLSLNAATLFLLGAVAMACLLLGQSALRRGTKRAIGRSREQRRLVKAAKQAEQTSANQPPADPDRPA